MQILSCLYRHVPVPPTVVALSARLAATACTPIEMSSNRLTALMARLAEVRRQIARGDLSDSRIITQELTLIRTELSAWLKSVSPSCACESFVQSEAFELGLGSRLGPYGGVCHRYPDVSSAFMWNNYRVTQILVCDMILSQLRPVATKAEDSSETREAQMKCSRIRPQMRQFAEEICYSVPDVLGLLHPHASGAEPGPSLVRSSVGGFVLLFPLSFAVVVVDHPSSLSHWVFECFEVLARVMGIQRALVLRQFLPGLCGQYSWADKFAFPLETIIE